MNNEYTQMTHEELNTVISDEWDFEKSAIEVELKDSHQDFLKIIETLTRIGVAVRNENRLIQSCHILQKKGKFYILHFKELFLLDGRNHTNFTVEDSFRRNTIAMLLQDWELCKIVDSNKITGYVPLRKIKILSHKEKPNWTLENKYTIGGHRR